MSYTVHVKTPEHIEETAVTSVGAFMKAQQRSKTRSLWNTVKDGPLRALVYMQLKGSATTSKSSLYKVSATA